MHGSRCASGAELLVRGRVRRLRLRLRCCSTPVAVRRCFSCLPAALLTDCRVLTRRKLIDGLFTTDRVFLVGRRCRR